MTPTTKEWYDLAATDLGVAKHLYETYYPKPLEIICYHCQQSAEKAIKAMIMHYGAQGGMPKLHDLSFLLNQVKNMVHVEEKFYDYADTLAPYGVSVRYPNEIVPGRQTCQRGNSICRKDFAMGRKHCKYR